MYKIGILSDTHGLLRPEVLRILNGCDAIIHAGDINRQSILDELAQIAPLYVVRGNNDKDWSAKLPESIHLNLYGRKIFVIHNKNKISEDLADVDLVVHGHTHKYSEKRNGGICYLNPGSCGPRRIHQEITLALLHLEEDNGWHIEKINIAHPEAEEESEKNVSMEDLNLKLPAIRKDIAAQKTVTQIARKHHLSQNLAEQIVRMYLTHPGVDNDGILERLR